MASPVTGSGSFVSSLPKYADLKKAAANPVQQEQMGQQAFLTLFTAQLQNQDPLDPVKNEAFVAQLAQFSQLEATTKMADSLQSMATAQKSERLLTGTGLIGRKVAAPDGRAQLMEGANISGSISVPNGADKVQLDVYDALGRKVFTQSLGRQAPGEVTVTWPGYNMKGERLPEGQYKVVATVNSFGNVTQVPISTPATVKSVVFNATTNDLMLEVEGGGSVPLSQVKRIDS
jgi:flagellar basal-body rod modification protein FlgD